MLYVLFQFSSADRRDHLRRFEVLLLTDHQVEEFTQMYDRRMFDISEPLFHAWLSLKFGSVQMRGGDDVRRP